MYFDKYIKYFTKNKLNGGYPKDDIKILESIVDEKIFIQSTDKCNSIEAYDISSISSIVLDIKNYREVKKNNNAKTEGTGVMYFKQMEINGKIFIAKTMIGQGSSGIVLSYINEDPSNQNKCGVVIKYGRIMDDANILSYMQSRNICPTAYVNSLVHKFKVNNEMHGFIIMEYMDGTLEDYIKNNSNLSYDIIKKILADISAQIYCISKYDLMYTDIKMANILYKCNKSNKIIDFTLGDLGGITNKANKNADNKAIATFPAPERCIENCGVFLDPNEKDVVWSLGIMFLSMIGYNTYKYNFEDLMNLKKGGNIENLINESLVDTRKILDAKITGSVQPVVSEPGIVSNSGVDYFMEILTGMLKINKDERMTLHEVYVKARIIV